MESSSENDGKNNIESNEWVSPPAYLNARVWEHFKVSKDKRFTLCVHCKTVIAYTNSNTSGMKRHMCRKHPTIDLQPKSKIKSASTCDDSEKKSNDVKPTPLLSNYFSVIKKGSARDAEIRKALMEFIIEDIRYPPDPPSPLYFFKYWTPKTFV